MEKLLQQVSKRYFILTIKVMLHASSRTFR